MWERLGVMSPPGTKNTLLTYCWIFPLEILPPRDLNGGVVYLRIEILSPEEASRIYISLFLERDYPGKVIMW
jgi:hypothetical protein